MIRSADQSVARRRIVKVGDKDVRLSPKEYKLLHVLVQHPARSVTHRLLLAELWDGLTDAQYLRVVRASSGSRSRPIRTSAIGATETGIGCRLRAAD